MSIVNTPYFPVVCIKCVSCFMCGQLLWLALVLKEVKGSGNWNLEVLHPSLPSVGWSVGRSVS